VLLHGAVAWSMSAMLGISIQVVVLVSGLTVMPSFSNYVADVTEKVRKLPRRTRDRCFMHGGMGRAARLLPIPIRQYIQ